MQQFNIVYISVFAFASIWTIFKLFKVNPNIIIETKFIKASTILFILAAVFSILTLFVNSGMMDYIRTFVMVIAIIIYLMLKEGLGNDGFYVNGHFTPYKDVIYYDYFEEKKKFNVVFKLKDTKGEDQFNANLDFNLKDKEKVIKTLNKKMPKKQKRIKKQA
ncbi:MAG: hypothetical protein GX368_04005 [Erysipelotrichaceae bacterium]|nr:hypothetical protein [Erysipelotrichaceae bacterium]